MLRQVRTLGHTCIGWHMRTLTGTPFIEVISVAFSPNGKLVVSASEDRTIKIFDTESGAEVRYFVGLC